MSYQLPLTIDFGSFPQTAKGYTPQQMADKLSSNATFTTEQQFALFQIGGTAPTSNIGPWLKDGTTWYVWSDDAGTYIPETIAQSSLQYWVGNSAPDHNVYQFWLKLDTLGRPSQLLTWYSGSWVNIDYVSQEDLSAFQTNLPQGKCNFKASPGGAQDFVFAGAGTLTQNLTFAIEVYDPDNCFAASKFTCPAQGYYHLSGTAQFGLQSGAPTSSAINCGWVVNGTAIDSLGLYADLPDKGVRIYSGSMDFFLNLNDTVQMNAAVTVDAICTWRCLPDYTRISGFRTR